MENCTNCDSNFTGHGDERGDFKVLGLLIPAMAVLLYFLNVPTTIALCTTQAVAKGLRMFLISTLLSGILLNTSSILMGLIALVTVISGAPAPPPLLCRFLLWVVNIGQSARCLRLKVSP